MTVRLPHPVLDNRVPRAPATTHKNPAYVRFLRIGSTLPCTGKRQATSRLPLSRGQVGNGTGLSRYDSGTCLTG